MGSLHHIVGFISIFRVLWDHFFRGTNKVCESKRETKDYHCDQRKWSIYLLHKAHCGYHQQTSGYQVKCPGKGLQSVNINGTVNRWKDHSRQGLHYTENREKTT